MNPFSEMKADISEFFHKSRLTRTVMWIFVLLFPLFLTCASNYITLGSFEELCRLISQSTGSFIYAALIVYMIFFIFAALFTNTALSSLITGVLVIIFSLVDFFKFSILQEHFLPWEIVLAQNLSSFKSFLADLVVPEMLFEVIITTLFYLAFLFLMSPRLSLKRKIRLPFCPVFIIILALFVGNSTVRQIYPAVFGISLEGSIDQAGLYEKHGSITAFALNFGSLNLSVPKNYSQGYIEKAFAEYLPDENSDASFQNPDIVVVLSESYWDPTALENVTFSADPLENYRAIAAEHPSGKMISPTFGGGTVRPEFEILTGMTTSVLPTGNIPYQQYVTKDTPSYPRYYKYLGYDTVGLHTYQADFYSRDKAYPFLGFDEFLGEYDLHAEQHWNSGPYITDETIAEEVIYQLEQEHETGIFVMAITMENHGLYREKYEEKDRTIKVSSDVLTDQQILAIENYVAGVKNSDLALKTIYDYVMSREKPTVVLWYGDHLPTLGEDFAPYTTTGTISSSTAAEWTDEEKHIMFSTPYVMFANYDTGKEYRAEGDSVSAYLLTALMADYIDAPETLQTNFLMDMYNVCPIMSPYYNFYTEGSNKNEREKMLELHELMTYDILIGKNYIGDFIEENSP